MSRKPRTKLRERIMTIEGINLYESRNTIYRKTYKFISPWVGTLKRLIQLADL